MHDYLFIYLFIKESIISLCALYAIPFRLKNVRILTGFFLRRQVLTCTVTWTLDALPFMYDRTLKNLIPGPAVTVHLTPIVNSTPT